MTWQSGSQNSSRQGGRARDQQSPATQSPARSFVRLSRGIATLVALSTSVVAPHRVLAAEPGKVDFLREVRPILANHCFKCHGQDEAARKAKFRLDVRESAIAPAKSGAVPIVPGKPNKSEVVRRIFAEDDDQMPPSAAKRPLTPEQKEILKRWIGEGAEYKPHWAFIKPAQPPL